MTSLAQNENGYLNEIETLLTEILSFVSKLDNQIDSLFGKEKAKKLNRNLGYFRTDLTDYLRIRKKLMDYLNANNYNVPQNDETKRTVSKLKKELGKITERLKDLRPYVSSELSNEAEDIIERIYLAAQGQRARYLTRLDELLVGGQVDKVKLQKEGETIYNELTKSVELINSIQSKLKIKFSL